MGVVVIARWHGLVLTLRPMMGRRRAAHVRTSCATPDLEHADLLLQFLDIKDGLLEDLQLKLLLLTLLVLARLFRGPRTAKLVIFVVVVVIVYAVIAAGGD
jgi:hypothetical protein